MSNSNHDPKNKECLLNHLDPICFPSGNVRPFLHIEHDMNGKKFVCPYSVCTCPEQKEEWIVEDEVMKHAYPGVLSIDRAIEICNLAEQRGRDAQQKEDYEIAKAHQEKAFKSGTEMGENRGRMETITAFVEAIKRIRFHVNIEEYLPMVQAWDKKNYDKPFDDGYAKAKADLLSFADSLKSNLTQKS